MTEDQIVPLISLPFSLLVLGLALWHRVSTKRGFSAAQNYRRKAWRLVQYLDEDILKLRRIAQAKLDSPPPTTVHPPEPKPLPPPPLSALELEMQEAETMISDFLVTLKLWDSTAPTPTAALNHYERKSRARTQSLQSATNVHQIGAVQEELMSLQKETVSLVIAESDQTLDGARKIRQLQASIDSLVRMCKLIIIDPTKGDPFDKSLHHSMGTLKTEPGYRRDSIAVVLSRGLREPAGDVLKQVEVKVYD